jgi:iron complex transport system substrate-binding protein
MERRAHPRVESCGRGRVARRLLWCLVTAIGIAAPAQAAPQRVVSLNLCTDQLVLMLTKRENIASVSYHATNPETSFMADRTTGIPTNHGRAEEILPINPDLVVAGRFTSQPTVALLRRLGYPVLILDLPEDWNEVRLQVREVASAVGEIARGESLLSEMDRGLDAASDASRDRGTALLYLPNGFASGSRTIEDAMVRAAGYVNLAARNGIVGRGSYSLEQVALDIPDVLVISAYGQRSRSLSEAFLSHRLLRRAMAERPMIRIPTRLWICPGPMLAGAVELLAAVKP